MEKNKEIVNKRQIKKSKSIKDNKKSKEIKKIEKNINLLSIKKYVIGFLIWLSFVVWISYASSGVISWLFEKTSWQFKNLWENNNEQDILDTKLWNTNVTNISSVNERAIWISSVNSNTTWDYLQNKIYNFWDYMIAPSNMVLYTWDNAMSFCSNLDFGWYTDWYLPNLTELQSMYKHKNVISWFSDVYYWSSTEYISSNVYSLDFKEWIHYNLSKSTANFVRCIRKF